jgi:hypothetical protein
LDEKSTLNWPHETQSSIYPSRQNIRFIDFDLWFKYSFKWEWFWASVSK